MKLISAAAPLFCAASLLAQTAIPLWPEGAPGAKGHAPEDIPTITPFLAPAENATGAAMLILPGGAYVGLAPHEGPDYARWCNSNGISGFVLKYRLGGEKSGGYRHPAMLEDAARAIRLIRARSAEWKIDPKKVGIMGSSAGGHLASTLLTHFDAGNTAANDDIEHQSSRPDLGVLCYPVITLEGPNAHLGSRRSLLGSDPSPELVKLLSNEQQVTAQTPPCFIWHTYEDTGVKPENSMMFAEALRKAGVPFELHIYEKGPHGLGLGTRDYNPAKWHRWQSDLAFWLRERGFARNP